MRRAPLERAQARDELGEGERLAQVVVGAEGEALDALGDGGRGGEHEDPRRALLADEPAADVVAVDDRQVAVEHDGVVVDDRGAAQRRRAVERDVDRAAGLAQAARQRVGEQRLVLGDQHAHRRRTVALSR